MKGLRVLNTRPKGQNKALTSAIERRGGVVIECPLLEIKPLPATWFDRLPTLNTVQQAIFTSQAAVLHCFNVFREWPAHIQVLAIGKKTASKLKEHGIKALFPPLSTSESLLEQEALQAVQNNTILLFKGVGGRLLIEETLKARGAKVIPVEVYQRLCPQRFQKPIAIWPKEGMVDIILFSSEEAMQHMFLALCGQAKVWLKKTPCIVFSERLQIAATKLGMEHIVVCRPESILEALHQFSTRTDLWQKHRKT